MNNFGWDGEIRFLAAAQLSPAAAPILHLIPALSNKEKRPTMPISFLWLGLRFRNITFTQEEDVDVKEIRELLDEKPRRIHPA